MTKKLEDQTRQYYDAIEDAPIGIVLWDAKDRLVKCNRAFREIHGQFADILKPGLKADVLLRRLKEAGLQVFENEKLVDAESGPMERRNRQTIPDVIAVHEDRWFQLRRQRLADGISPSMQPHVFDAFNRLGFDSTNIKGTGIGLTVSKHLTNGRTDRL